MSLNRCNHCGSHALADTGDALTYECGLRFYVTNDRRSTYRVDERTPACKVIELLRRAKNEADETVELLERRVRHLEGQVADGY